MKGSEFIRKIKALGRENGIPESNLSRDAAKAAMERSFTAKNLPLFVTLKMN
jgi:hypothetical protein